LSMGAAREKGTLDARDGWGFGGMVWGVGKAYREKEQPKLRKKRDWRWLES